MYMEEGYIGLGLTWREGRCETERDGGAWDSGVWSGRSLSERAESGCDELNCVHGMRVEWAGPAVLGGVAGDGVKVPLAE